MSAKRCVYCDPDKPLSSPLASPVVNILRSEAGRLASSPTDAPNHLILEFNCYGCHRSWTHRVDMRVRDYAQHRVHAA